MSGSYGGGLGQEHFQKGSNHLRGIAARKGYVIRKSLNLKFSHGLK